MLMVLQKAINHGIAGCGGVFRNHRAEFVYDFAEPLGFSSSTQAELFTVIIAIEVAFRMHWNNLWIETGSSFVVRAFQNSSNAVTWNLRNRWINALVKFKQLNGIPIFYEKLIKLQILCKFWMHSFISY
jgi:ribonuclease HI